MKELYRFTLEKEVTKEVTETAADGTKTITPTKVKEPVTFVLKKPSRPEKDEAKLFYGDIYRDLASAYDKEGKPKKHLLMRTQLMRQYNDSGGAFSENQKQFIDKLAAAVNEKRAEYLTLIATKVDDKERLEKTQNEWRELRRELTKLEQDYNSLFEQCAETVAEQKVVLWMALFLTYVEKDGALNPLFPGQTYEEKLTAYDELEEKEDAFSEALIRKLGLYFSLIYMNVAKDKEDFELYEKELFE